MTLKIEVEARVKKDKRKKQYNLFLFLLVRRLSSSATKRDCIVFFFCLFLLGPLLQFLKSFIEWESPPGVKE